MLIGETSKTAEIRHAELTRLIETHGVITRDDVADKTDRYQRMIAFETAEDLRLLEHFWAYRDVVAVLISGVQGTEFENVMWTLADAEVDRIKAEFGRFQNLRVCRNDIPAEVFGSLIVGTYVLLAIRMSRLPEKPDLAEWARSLHLLIREGSIPQSERSKV
jgi:flavorubredoxin